MTLSSPFAWDTGRDGGENAIGVSKSRSPRRTTNATVHATVEGSSPRWHLPGRAHVPQPYENHISSGLSEFIQNRTARKPGSAGFGGSRRHFPVIQTPTQREPQLSTANNVDYYKRMEGAGGSSPNAGGRHGYRRHLSYVVPPKPVERVQRLKQFPRESSGGILWDASNRGAQKKEKQVRFAGGEAKRDGGAHSGPTYPEPNLPRLGRTFKKLETSITRPEQSLADTLGRRVKVNTKDFKNSDRAGAQRILRGTPSRVEDETSLSGESFFGRKVDLITFKRFVSNLSPAPRVPLMESLKRSSHDQRVRETNREIAVVKDLDNWKHSI